jgi:hypothetical protein
MLKDSRKNLLCMPKLISNRFKDNNSYSSSTNSKLLKINRFCKPCLARTQSMTRSRCSSRSQWTQKLMNIRKSRIHWLSAQLMHHHSRWCISRVLPNQRAPITSTRMFSIIKTHCKCNQFSHSTISTKMMWSWWRMKKMRLWLMSPSILRSLTTWSPLSLRPTCQTPRNPL